MKTKSKVKAKTKAKTKSPLWVAEICGVITDPWNELRDKVEQVVKASGDTVDLDLVAEDFVKITELVIRALSTKKVPGALRALSTYLHTIIEDVLQIAYSDGLEGGKKIKVLGEFLPLTAHENHNMRTCTERECRDEYANWCMGIGVGYIRAYGSATQIDHMSRIYEKEKDTVNL